MRKAYADGPVYAGQLVSIRHRSWVERLFSWPWKPWLTVAVRSIPTAEQAPRAPFP